jgi:hypothetical protein
MIRVIPATPATVPGDTSNMAFPQCVTISPAATPWMEPGNFQNLKIKIAPAPGIGNSRIYTVWLANGETAASSTAFAVTISGTATEGSIATPLAVAQNDHVELRSSITGSPGALSAFNAVVEFEATDPDASGYSIRTIQPNSAAVSYTNPFVEAIAGSGIALTTIGPATMTMPIPGTVNGYAMRYANSDFGSGRGYEGAWYKNGVKQDGSGGTVDTRLSILSGGTPSFSDFTTFTLTYAQGDTVAFEITPVGSPIGPSLAIATSFTPDTAGESIWGGMTGSGPHQANPSFVRMNGSASEFPNWGTSETIITQSAVTDTRLTIDRLYVRLGTAPGSGKSHVIDGRLNGASPSGTLAVTIADAATTGSDLVNAISVTDADDLLGLRAVPSGTPATTSVVYSMRVVALAPEIRGSFVAGTVGTVTSTRTALFNMDAVTRDVSAVGSLCVGGSFVLFEQGSAPVGIPGTARIFAQDNGGKTELMVIFGTGSAQQLAIEP